MAGKDGAGEFAFYGRGDEQARLRALLTDLVAAPKTDEPGWSHIAILHGLGGIGKTTLLRHRVEPWLRSPAYADRCTLVSVDWETERERKPASFPSEHAPSLTTVLDILRTAAGRAGLDRYFKPYGELRDKQEDATRKLALPPRTSRRSGEDTGDRRVVQVIELIVSLAAKGLGVPDTIPLDKVVKLTQVGFEEAQGLVVEAHQRIRATLTAEQHALLTNPNGAYAESFADCLRAAATKRPLVIMLDTYEIVRGLGPLLRQVMSRSGVRVAWVLAGRLEATDEPATDLGAFINEVQPSERLRSIPVQHFNHSDVRGMLTDAAGLSLSDADARRLHKATHGIPLAVQAAVRLLHDEVPLSSILEDTSDGSPQSTIAHKLTRRFLSHLLREGGDPWGDLPRLLSLAIIDKSDDTQLIGAMLAVDDPTRLLHELSARHAFLFGDELRLHEVVREVFRKHVLDPVHRGPIAGPNRRAIAVLEQRLRRRNDSLPTLEERVTDDRWKATAGALASHRFLNDFEDGWHTVVTVFPAALAFDSAFAMVLTEHVTTFIARASPAERRRTAILRDLSLQGRPSEEHSWLRAVPRRSGAPAEPDDGCAPERAAILAWWQGDLYANSKRYGPALESFREACRTVPDSSVRLRQSIAASLDSLARTLAWQDDIPPRIAADVRLQAARLAAELVPGAVKILFTLVEALYDVHNHREAAAVCDRMIELEPGNSYCHAKRSEAYFLLHADSTALAAADFAIRLDPGNPQGHLRRSAVLTALRRHDESLAAIDQALRLEPDNLETYSHRSDALAWASRFAEALDAADKAIAISPTWASGHHRRSIALGRLGRFDEALSAITRAIDLDPNYASLHAWRSTVLSWMGKHDTALDAAHESVKLDPLAPNSHLALSEVLHTLRQYDKALANADHAIELDPDDAYAHRARATILVSLDRAEEALAEAGEAIRLGDNNSDNHVCRSQVLSALKCHDQALAAVDIALALDPTDLYALGRRIDCLIKTGNTAEAVRIAENIVAGNPENAARWNSFGSTLLWAQRFPEALQAFRTSAALAPTVARPVWNQGRALIFTQRYSDALAAYDQAVRLEPDNSEWWAWRAELLMDLGEYDRSLADCDEAIRLRPEIPNQHHQRARILSRLDDELGRRQAFHRAIELAISEWEINVTTGTSAWFDGDYGTAEQCFVRVTEIDPDIRPLTWLQIGVIARHRGDEALAAHRIQRALSIPFSAHDVRSAFGKAQRNAIALLCLDRADEALDRIRGVTRLAGDLEETQIFDLLETAPRPPARLAELRRLCRRPN